METILKYKWEDIYFSDGCEALGISPINIEIDQLMKSQRALEKNLLHKEMKVHNLTRPGIKVNHMQKVSSIIEDLKKFYPDLRISVYVLRNDLPEAFATSKTSFVSKDNEYIIVLSQHFFNYLDADEGKAVIAHEFAHFYHNHTSVPSKLILNRFSYQRDTIEYKKFITNLKKWRICKEISADLFALQFTRNWKKVASALIKYSTAIFEDSNLLIEGFKQQFESIRDSRNCEDLKEHPLLLLRVMILHDVGKYMQQKGWDNLFDNDVHREVQNIIDNSVFYVYPEITLDKVDGLFEIIYGLGQVVAVSDGELDESELEYLNFICSSSSISPNADIDELIYICEQLNLSPPNKVPFELFKKNKIDFAVEKLGVPKEKEGKVDISTIVRHLLYLAKQDNEISYNELLTIYDFAKHDNFGWNKSDVIQQIFNLGQD